MIWNWISLDPDPNLTTRLDLDPVLVRTPRTKIPSDSELIDQICYLDAVSFSCFAGWFWIRFFSWGFKQKPDPDPGPILAGALMFVTEENAATKPVSFSNYHFGAPLFFYLNNLTVSKSDNGPDGGDLKENVRCSHRYTSTRSITNCIQ